MDQDLAQAGEQNKLQVAPGTCRPRRWACPGRLAKSLLGTHGTQESQAWRWPMESLVVGIVDTGPQI